MRVSGSSLFVLVACSHNTPAKAPQKPQAAAAAALSPMAAAAAEAAASQGAAPRSARRPGGAMKAKASSADSPIALEAGDAPRGSAAAASAPAPPPPPPVAWECFERSILSSLNEANERFTRQRMIGDTLEVDTVLGGGEQATIARLHFARTDDGLRTSWRGFSMHAKLEAPDATNVSITLTLKNGSQVREHRTIEGDELTLVGGGDQTSEVVLHMQRRDCGEIEHVFADSESIFFSVDHPEAPNDE